MAVGGLLAILKKDKCRVLETPFFITTASGLSHNFKLELRHLASLELELHATST
jgi:hypothetical protein